MYTAAQPHMTTTRDATMTTAMRYRPPSEVKNVVGADVGAGLGSGDGKGGVGSAEGGRE